MQNLGMAKSLACLKNRKVINGAKLCGGSGEGAMN